ncbi:AsmA-like C-terminal region-containing protein [Roseomonas gilardii subsp. gilardii]|uniref:AsmA-like C-terminal region-containing protein n=1 Tax=Roseomonas gilardii TaxID=257708 RepID=UPI001FF8AB05|nr:AsmA-like C-terminal region-containing protein [Roseomonas gilardii]UPG72284.1 AsmA-like C-terminal region-containing protein [Roseomonas gilardii subsp. gilardii]
MPGFDAEIALGQVLTSDGPFERVEARIRHDAQGVLRQMQASGRFGGQEAFAARVTPRAGGGRDLSVRVADLGLLLRLTGTTGDVQDGRLRVQGHWAADTPASPLLGEAELENFGLRGRARLGKLLQALSLYGIPEALTGPGLRVSRLHAPFALTREALGLEDVRLNSASLGATAKGRVMRRDGRLELEGTIVPSYLLNILAGRLPLVGRLFSAEPGGGLLAATFRATGTLSDPQITVNPLSMLAPGMLRNLFGSDAPPRER